MSTALKINGVSLVPIKEAAKLVSYTRDYVARLAREQKITASQVGRQWYVDVDSLQKFALGADLTDEVRKSALSSARKRELLAAADFEAITLAVRATHQVQRRAAAVSTLAVLCVGLFAGVTFYTALLFYTSGYLPQHQSIARVGAPVLALVTNTITNPDQNDALAVLPNLGETLLLTTIMEQPVFTSESETRRLKTLEGGIVLLPKNGRVETVSDVAALFSDPVAVVYEGTSEGTILFTRSTGEVAAFPFVSIQSQAATTTSVLNDAFTRPTN